MSVNITVNCKIVGDGEFQFSYPLAPVSTDLGNEIMPDEDREAVRLRDARREDRVLPLGSSTLVPGLSVHLAP